MLRRPPINLNKQAEEATVLLIREVLEKGIQLSEVREISEIFSLVKRWLIDSLVLRST